MRITSKGQVTVPLEIRSKRGHGRGSDLVARLRGKADVRMTTDEILALTRKRA